MDAQKGPKFLERPQKNKMAPFLERTDKQLDKWTKEQAKEEQGVFNSRTIIIIFFVLQIKKQMAVSCSGRSLARGGSTRQFPPPYPPTTTQPFSRFISNICMGYMRRCQIMIQFECGKTSFFKCQKRETLMHKINSK